VCGHIHALIVPKWGLTMERGKLTRWIKAVGDRVEKGMEVCDLETEKIANGVEAPASGILRRTVAVEGDVLGLGALLGIIAGESASEAEIDAAVARYQAEAAAAASDAPSAEGPQPEHIEVGGRRLRHLIQRGSGEAVVLVHGFGGNLENWLMNHGDLSAGGWTVAALDLPGHGESSKSLESGSLAELAQVVIDYLDAVGLGEVHLVGHSMGAAVCLETARRAAGRVKSLTLLAPAGLGQAVNREFLEAFASADSRKPLKAAMHLLFANEDLVTRQLVDDTLKYKRLEGVTEALTKLAGNALGEAVEAVPAELGAVPTLVIWGDRDAIIAPPAVEALIRPGVSVKILEGYGHMVQVEAATEVNSLIRQFIG
jgi:pyruvate dehydrogenase E2 component (dihydrolipoamide acetyltransferase)